MEPTRCHPSSTQSDEARVALGRRLGSPRSHRSRPAPDRRAGTLGRRQRHPGVHGQPDCVETPGRAADGLEEFRGRSGPGASSSVVHASYLVNLAAADPVAQVDRRIVYQPTSDGRRLWRQGPTCTSARTRAGPRNRHAPVGEGTRRDPRRGPPRRRSDARPGELGGRRRHRDDGPGAGCDPSCRGAARRRPRPNGHLPRYGAPVGSRLRLRRPRPIDALLGSVDANRAPTAWRCSISTTRGPRSGSRPTAMSTSVPA